ncbi:MAG: ribulose-phosphate 3-epimerase [Parcubacteria group bacterium Gr01-1014_48]|nr:MAG: ribulose-phosphate 3-epimerase [Parcubacteria group bacterium Greene0416_14]TSC74054.1 MAG: ribulose-phosphate 3-epimerase [Parcubacteria group bacterium Gr01-1014_48]TSD01157.1 MAG: ribulose-phosphate 3-epimerase [Parcubacteria group bacterium Greene1014_15]TSD08233.1 MAG: ribulose-phosphate 3-epimerase [Parcubacteria group bacterium Greene0714_4]
MNIFSVIARAKPEAIREYSARILDCFGFTLAMTSIENLIILVLMLMIEIIPAIMPSSYEDIEEKARKVASLVSYVQIDAMDGKFVSSVSWPYLAEEDVAKNFELPFQDTIRYEVDLMVSDPLSATQIWVKAGVSRILFHVESVQDPRHFVETVSAQHDGVEIGVAINTITPNDILEPLLSKIAVVQFMGIAKIGYQGQPFDERVVEKIKELRQKRPETILSVDGGVNFDTAPRLVEAGATRLVAGSAIFKTDDIKETIKKFQQLG